MDRIANLREFIEFFKNNKYWDSLCGAYDSFSITMAEFSGTFLFEYPEIYKIRTNKGVYLFPHYLSDYETATMSDGREIRIEKLKELLTILENEKQ